MPSTPQSRRRLKITPHPRDVIDDVLWFEDIPQHLDCQANPLFLDENLVLKSGGEPKNGTGYFFNDLTGFDEEKVACPLFPVNSEPDR
jgi:hypothetical protein